MARSHEYDERPTDELIQLYERAASEHSDAQRRGDSRVGTSKDVVAFVVQ